MWVGQDNKFKKPPTLRRRFTVDSHVPGSESVQKISKPPFPFVARMVSISSVSLQSSPLSLYLIWSSPRKMNGAGRQGLRSGAAGVHHQRQYSDNFLDGSSNSNQWLQSVGLQHLQSSSNQLPPLQVAILSSIDLHKRFGPIWWDSFLLWNASRTITCTEVHREEECTGMRRGALTEEMSFIWSLPLLPAVTVLRCRKRMAKISPLIPVPACWICIRLTPSFFLLRLLFSTTEELSFDCCALLFSSYYLVLWITVTLHLFKRSRL